MEGAPDPFPSLTEAPAKAHPTPSSNGTPDTDSVIAFPSLASSAPPAIKAPPTAWSAPRIKATVSKQPTYSDSFTIPVGDLSSAGRDGRPTSLGEVMKQVMAQHKVKLDASTNQKLRQTTFFLKSENKKDFEKAKKALLAGLSPVVRHFHIAMTVNIDLVTLGLSHPQRPGFHNPQHHWFQGCYAQGNPRTDWRQGRHPSQGCT